MSRKVFALSMVLFVTFAGQAMATDSSLELGINDYSLHGTFDFIVSEDDKGYSQLMLGGMYNDRKDTNLGTMGLGVFGKVAQVPGMRIGVSLDGYGGESDKEEFLAGGFGAHLIAAPPALQGFGIDASFVYCPKVFTTLDADRMRVASIKAKYDIIPRASVFVGFFHTRGNFENTGDRTLDEGFRGGVQMRF